MPNSDAAEQMIAALGVEHLTDMDAARVEAVRALARAVDADPFNASLWRQYREAVEVLMPDGGHSDELDELYRDLLTPVRHAED